MLPWFLPIYQQLVERLQRNTLHHALLLDGVAGLGKQQLSTQLAQSILCSKHNACGQCQSCQLFGAGSHPDYLTLKSDKQISVDEVRDAIKRLQGKSQLSGYKVLIIVELDNMTLSAANALLKTLEEPTNQTIIIMTSSAAHRLLATIKSRCQVIKLSPPTSEMALSWLAEQGYRDIDEEHLLAFSGAPLAAIQASDDEQLSYRQFCLALDKTHGQGHACYRLAQNYQEHHSLVISWCMQMLNQSYLQHMDEASYQAYQQCLSAKQTLQHVGVNKALVLQTCLQNTYQFGAHHVR